MTQAIMVQQTYKMHCLLSIPHALFFLCHPTPNHQPIPNRLTSPSITTTTTSVETISSSSNSLAPIYPSWTHIEREIYKTSPLSPMSGTLAKGPHPYHCPHHRHQLRTEPSRYTKLVWFLGKSVFGSSEHTLWPWRCGDSIKICCGEFPLPYFSKR